MSILFLIKAKRTSKAIIKKYADIGSPWKYADIGSYWTTPF